MDKLKMHTPNKADENFKKLAELFPNAVTETIDENGEVVRAIDKDVLMQEISCTVVDGKEERYQFTWPDKKKSVLLANAPISKTLRPCREESVDFDTTENLYIEGDNLDALKLLQETYLGKVKLIFIDPPYNTGKDSFLYNDNFSVDISDYANLAGQYDEDGNLLFDLRVNNESNGRFHSDWLNMLYPRLKIAKDLMSDDGAIFISIDDNELDNLKKICDEIFSAQNFVNIISVKLKNIAGASGGGEDKRLKKNMEYILVYAKNYSALQPFENVYTVTPISELVEQYRQEGVSWKYTTALVNPGEKEYIGSTVDGEGSEIKIYKRVNFSIQSIGQIMKNEGLTEAESYAKYAHCIFQTAMPQSSIRPRVMKKVQELGIKNELFSIEYVPRSGRNKGQLYEQFYRGENFRLFAWLKDVSDEVDGVLCKKDLQGTFWDFVGETKNLTKEGKVPFPNGKKPLKMLKQILTMQSAKDSIILDFFSGSATTGHATMLANADDEGNRKFIMIQLPEETPVDSDERKAGFCNICELGKERLRIAGREIKEERGFTAQNIDIGFRVLKCDTSNMKDVYYSPSDFDRNLLDLMADNIKEDRTPEDLLFQVMLDLGVELSSKIEETTIAGKKVFDVADGFLIACFDKDVNDETIKAIAQKQPYYFVMRDSSLANDSVATNFEQIFATYSPDTVRKVL
jgi:adenine-specific DNA-methyltransferase